MSVRAHVSDRAHDDLFTHAAYIMRDSLEAALRLVNAVESSYVTLQEMPGIGEICEEQPPGMTELRRYFHPRFPNYVIYYHVVDARVHVIRILHASQDRPGILRRG
jgi:plasmid stabilization system protein ParE